MFLRSSSGAKELLLLCFFYLFFLTTNPILYFYCPPADTHHLLPAGPRPRLRHQHRAPHRGGVPQGGNHLEALFKMCATPPKRNPVFQVLGDENS